MPGLDTESKFNFRTSPAPQLLLFSSISTVFTFLGSKLFRLLRLDAELGDEILCGVLLLMGDKIAAAAEDVLLLLFAGAVMGNGDVDVELFAEIAVVSFNTSGGFVLNMEMGLVWFISLNKG